LSGVIGAVRQPARNIARASREKLIVRGFIGSSVWEWLGTFNMLHGNLLTVLNVSFH
jgi:hypothetical protein